MPIPREIRRLHYGTHWLRDVRPRILALANNHCERCGVANGAVGVRTKGLFHPVPVRRRRGREITIVLTVAHLNHVPGDDGDDNLRAWCQRCHLLYDREHHHQTRALRKDEARPLLRPIERSS